MIESIARVADRIARIVRAVLGVPDYEAYLAHVAASHPERVPLTREQFAWESMQSRYSSPGSRCC
ncbi:MAG: YbdD/YjiX family protein [Gemmatimonadaceae bacterium]|nr:YbdD/YjiX family protein [Gemmatimonadaceae bacterium]